jgi:hypothetical protein
MPECGTAVAGALMRDHYHGFSHPVLVDLPAEPTVDLFTEMDEIADELRTNPEHIAGDDEIAFRDLQRKRRPDLSKQEFRDLFAVWRDHYRARCEIKKSERRARIEQLSKQREELFAERAMAPPDQHAAVTARLFAIGRELAELQIRL